MFGSYSVGAETGRGAGFWPLPHPLSLSGGVRSYGGRMGRFRGRFNASLLQFAIWTSGSLLMPSVVWNGK